MSETESELKAKYDFKKAMKEIMGMRGRGTELISVYIPESRQISDVMAYLRDEYSQSSNIKSKSTMKNVQGAIDSIMSRLKTYKSAPEKGVVIFCGEVPRAGDQTRMVQYVIHPPEAITAFLYRCDSSFFTEPLETMLVDKKSYGLITIDRREATLGILTGSRIITLKHFDSLVPSKHHQGGQSSVRFERLIEIAAHEFYKKVAAAADTIQDIDLVEEKEFVQRFFREIRKTDGGLSAYGEDMVRDALNMGAVNTLLLSENIDKRRITVKCPQGHTYDATVTEADDKIQCKECGSTASVTRNEDLIDDFFMLADAYNTEVKIISADSEEGQMLMTAFGGIAAILRYRIQ